MKTRTLGLLTALTLSTLGGARAATCAGQNVTHALGQTCVSGVPKRVVSLEWTYTENLLALGVQPVGAADLTGYREWVRVPVSLVLRRSCGCDHDFETGDSGADRAAP